MQESAQYLCSGCPTARLAPARYHIPMKSPFEPQAPLSLGRHVIGVSGPSDPSYSLGARQTILCVDDEPDILATLAWFLSDEGFLVRTAGSGGEALANIEEHPPDFVITDYSMPGITGIQLCKRLRSRPETRHIPIIVYSAFALPSKSSAYDRVLTKPADLPVVAQEIRALLGQETQVRKPKSPF